MSKLTASQTAILRDSLIAQCAAAGSAGLPIGTLRQGCRLAGFGGLEDSDLETHLHFLTSDGKLEIKSNAIAAALKRWVITASGVRYAEENQLV